MHTRFFSFCYGGFDVNFRIYPAFVLLDFKNFIKSYDNDVYLFPPPYVLDSLDKRGEQYRLPWDLDELFNNNKNTPVKFFTSSKYKNRVNKMIKRNNLNVKFDGYFSYNLYKMKFKCVYGGNRVILIPNIKGKKNEGVMKEKNCNVYYIIDIINIKSISKIEN